MKRNQRHCAFLVFSCLTALPFASDAAVAQSMDTDVFSWESPARPAQLPSVPALPEDSDKDLQPLPLSLADLERLEGYKQPKLPSATTAPTLLETMYSGRAEEDLRQFGYDLFDDKSKPSRSLPSGTVRDDYVLGQDDEIEIVIRGQENERKTYKINSRGELVTDTLSPIPAAGRTLGDVRKFLEEETARLHNVEISVSLNAPRQIDVLVIGDVKGGGRKTLTPYHTVLDALQEAGGIRKTGSLRSIKLVRGGQSRLIDLYSVMMQGSSIADMTLHDGDRIIVPPVGPTIAVSGAVKRPGIYEIRRGEKLSAMEALGMAGGVLAPGSNRFLRLALSNDGLEPVENIADPAIRQFGDGSILNVAQAKEKRARNVTLEGHTRDPGQYDLKKTSKLSALLSSQRVLGESVYPLIGVIERHDPKSLTTSLIEFSPRQVLDKSFDAPLHEGDAVHLFSMEQIRSLVQGAPAPGGSFQKSSYSSADDKTINDAEIASFLHERCAFVRGSVRRPGAYPVAANTGLESLIAVSGGATVEADRDRIELTSREGINSRRIISLGKASGLKISPGDTIRISQTFNRVEEQSVILAGEIRNPGKYDLMPGDTLLSLIQRAGGLTDIAYPDGVIFSRAGERKQEENRYKAQARDLEMKLAESLRQQDSDKKPDMTQIAAVQTLIAQLKDAQAVGRITVQADPDILTSDPEQNILLEAGDKIYIPRRPLNVRVGGEVLSPASLQFRKGKEAQDYIREAGGTTYYADLDRAFVVYPNGSAQPLSVSAWKQSVTMIPPGSTIIVPRDPKPFDFLESAESVTQILANITLTGFYLHDLNNDD